MDELQLRILFGALPGFLLLIYIFKKDPQPEPKSRLAKAVPAHYAFGVLMGYYYSIHHFVDHSQRIAVCVLLVPVLAHGVYDAIALSSTFNPAVEGVSMLVLIVFCIYLHKYCKKRIAEQVARDRKASIFNNIK